MKFRNGQNSTIVTFILDEKTEVWMYAINVSAVVESMCCHSFFKSDNATILQIGSKLFLYYFRDTRAIHFGNIRYEWFFPDKNTELASFSSTLLVDNNFAGDKYILENARKI